MAPKSQRGEHPQPRDMAAIAGRVVAIMQFVAGLFALGVSLLLLCGLCGCAWRSGSFLVRREVTYRPDGSITEVTAPDRIAVGAVLGSATSIWTMQPWGVLAGGAAQVSESFSRLVTVPADVVTTSAR